MQNKCTKSELTLNEVTYILGEALGSVVVEALCATSRKPRVRDLMRSMYFFFFFFNFRNPSNRTKPWGLHSKSWN
jgi:hypothetical protein